MKKLIIITLSVIAAAASAFVAIDMLYKRAVKDVSANV